MALFRMKPHYRKRGGTLSKYGTLAPTALGGVYSMAAAAVGNYALFAGGVVYSYNGSTTNKSSVITYNSSLVRSSASALTEARYDITSAATKDYAVFAGGNTTTKNVSQYIDVYDSSGTKCYYSNQLVSQYIQSSATFVDDYFICAGGYYYDFRNKQNPMRSVWALQNGRTVIDCASLLDARYGIAAATVGNYALFAGGDTINSSSQSIGSGNVDAYDSSLTHTAMQNSLINARHFPTAAYNGNYALFAGGWFNNDYDLVDAYDSSLTHILAPSLSQARYNMAAATVGNYALFAGGSSISGNNAYDIVDAYDSSLTHILATPLSREPYSAVAASVGNYGLFISDLEGMVDVYQVT